MDNIIEQRALIKILAKSGENAVEIKSEMDILFGDTCLSLSTIRRWHREFSRGRESLLDDPRSGRPQTATIDEKVDGVRKVLTEYRNLSVKKIAEKAKQSKTSVFRILKNDLDMKKVNARVVPKSLKPHEKTKRVATSRKFLTKFGRNFNRYCDRIITSDETWVLYSNPPSKKSQAQWLLPGEKRPEVPKLTMSTKKVMATFFWDSTGIIMVDYLPQGVKMTGPYYSEMLKKLKGKILIKRPKIFNSKLYLLIDNAPIHKCKVAMQAITENGFELIDHPPYSPDLAPSDFHLFRHLKKFLSGLEFSDLNDLQTQIHSFFEEKDSKFFRDPFYDLISRLRECIKLKGNYLEN